MSCALGCFTQHQAFARHTSKFLDAGKRGVSLKTTLQTPGYNCAMLTPSWPCLTGVRWKLCSTFPTHHFSYHLTSCWRTHDASHYRTTSVNLELRRQPMLVIVTSDFDLFVRKDCIIIGMRIGTHVQSSYWAVSGPSW